MWPSGRRPLGKRESRTNSGRVRSSSLDSVNREPLQRVSTGLICSDKHHTPQFQGDVLVRAAERVDGRASTCLRHLSNDTRRASGRCHDVSERLERAVTFTVGRRGLSVVDVLAARSVLGVARECGFGLGSGCSSGRGRGLGEGRRGSKCRRRLVSWRVARFVGLLVGVARREVERREGRRVR